MPNGVPLTPKQIAHGAQVYAETGNFSEAARQVGVPSSTLRMALHRLGAVSSRHALGTAAIVNGLRLGRKRLREGLELARDRLALAANGRDFSFTLGSVSRATETMLSLDERNGKRRMEKLQRKKTAAETELIKAKTVALIEWDDILSRATPEERAEILAIAQRIKARPVGSADGAAESGSRAH